MKVKTGLGFNILVLVKEYYWLKKKNSSGDNKSSRKDIRKKEKENRVNLPEAVLAAGRPATIYSLS